MVYIVLAGSGYEGLPFEKPAHDIMSSEEFKDYVAEHGYHFTNEMATKACNMMKSDNVNVRVWSWKEVETAIAPMIADNNHLKFTNGDLTYLANMYLTDFYPNVVKDQNDCLRMAAALSNDKDGYPEMAFCRWVSDLVGKKIVDVDW